MRICARTDLLCAAVLLIATAAGCSRPTTEGSSRGGSDPTHPTRVQAPAAQYTVTFSEQNRRSVKIEARLPLDDGVILTCPEGAIHLPDGWASFVRGLTAEDDAGAPVTLEPLGGGRWQVVGSPTAVRLSYEVQIRHDEGRWPFGHDEAAYAKSDCVFSVGAALFVATAALRDVEVRFELPAGWRVSTPWKAIAGRENVFAVPTVEDLYNVGLLVGGHVERTIRVGGVEVVLAVGHDFEAAVDRFEAVVTPVLEAAVDLFGGVPVIDGEPAGKFVVIVNRDSFDGGGAFIRSVSMLFKDLPDRHNRRDWGHVVTHELLHLWNGQSLREARQEAWFTEGFTDYLAYALEARTGLITEDEYFASLARKYDEYRAVAGRLSMRAAGDDKGRNYDLVYAGGLVFALALDASLWRHTHGEKGLNDFMRELYREVAVAGGKFQLDDVVRIANRLCGADLTPLFRDHVEGTAVIRLEEHLRAFGLEVGSEATGDKVRTVLKRKAEPTPAERDLLAKLLRGA